MGGGKTITMKALLYAIRFMKKYLLIIKKNYILILLDFIAFLLAYFGLVWLRLSLSLPVWHAELFVSFGLVAAACFIATAIFTNNYQWVISRSFFGECMSVARHIFMSWSVFTFILFMIKEAHEFSRSLYVFAAIGCSLAIIVERTIYKAIVRSARHARHYLPGIVVVCNSDITQNTLETILPGTFSNRFEIVGVAMDDVGTCDYNDHFSSHIGREGMEEFILKKKPDAIYLKLTDTDYADTLVSELIDKGINVHLSIGSINISYQDKTFQKLGQDNVITLSNADVSVLARGEKLERYLKRIFFKH